MQGTIKSNPPPLPGGCDTNYKKMLGLVRGAIKKNWCFFTFSQKTETPPPPFLTTSVFSDKDFLDWPRPNYFIVQICEVVGVVSSEVVGVEKPGLVCCPNW